MARQQTAAEAAKEGASRLGRFAGATSDEQKKKQPDMVGRIQKYAQEEAERQKKKKAEDEAKKKAPVNTAPQDGFLTRMYKKYVSGEK